MESLILSDDSKHIYEIFNHSVILVEIYKEFEDSLDHLNFVTDIFLDHHPGDKSLYTAECDLFTCKCLLNTCKLFTNDDLSHLLCFLTQWKYLFECNNLVKVQVYYVTFTDSSQKTLTVKLMLHQRSFYF